MLRSARSNQSGHVSKKKVFEDVVCGTVSIPSDWQVRRLNRSKRSAQTQTSDDLYNLQEAEVQTGRYTNIYQAQVDPNHGNGTTTLLEYIHENQFKFTSNVRTSSTSTPANTVDWSQQIEDGFVTVDCEVETEPHTKVETDAFIEYVDYQKHCGIQTEKMNDLFNFPASANEAKDQEDDLEEEEGKSSRESKYDGDEHKGERNISSLPKLREYLPIKQPQQLLSFLAKKLPLFEEAIRENNEVDAFPHLRNPVVPESNEENDEAMDSASRIPLWRVLSVDLEKKKVLFPDWTKAKHFPGIILKVTTTRNKERVYDIEYEDGSRYFGVREEYLRLLDDPDNKKHTSAGGGKRGSHSSGQQPVSRLFEGMRVFCKVTSRSGTTKYYLGRIQKVHGKNTYDVEVLETSKIESGVMGEDLLVGGLQEGYRVEARKPLKQSLQSTSIGWNATGSMIGITYGKNDLYGWCDLPGALCCWNIFNKTFDAQVPDFIIDHSCCLMAVTFHPMIPTIVAVGSYNGEVMIWDLLKPEKPLAISPVIDYTHKESITQLCWIKAVNTPQHFVSNNLNELDAWHLMSASIDGRILYWSMTNRLSLPLKGYLLYGKNSHKFDSRRQLLVANASITALTLSSADYQRWNTSSGSSGSNGSTGNNSLLMFSPKWMMIGETNGEMIRIQVSRLGNKWISAETVRSFPSVEDVFVALNKKEEPFGHHPHIGSVSGLDWSPFHRNLFLSGGSDGRVKLFHILDPQPLEIWEPVAAGPQAGDALQFTTITAVKFSPHRPLVFAVGTSNGFIYLYDLTMNRKLPIVRLEPNEADLIDSNPMEGSAKNSSTTGLSSHLKQHLQSSHRKNSIISIAFNHRQRDLLSACDWYGKVFIWKLNWSLANRKGNELEQLNEMAQAFTSKR